MCLHHPWPREPEKTMGTHPAKHDLEPTASEEVSRVLPAHSTEVSVTSRSQAACCSCPNGCAAQAARPLGTEPAQPARANRGHRAAATARNGSSTGRHTN